MKIYYVEFELGCMLCLATSPERARASAQYQFGHYCSIHALREATEHDIEWVRGMHGYVPDLVEAQEARH